MKLELIVPATHKNRGKQKKALIPPLGLAMVAALTPPDIEVSLTDENVTAIDFQKQIDLVGITALTVTAQRAYQIADTFRAKGVQVVLGGIHPSVLPEEARQHADAIVIGEAEGVWPCRTIFNCTACCPRDIEVTRAIQEVKQAIVTGTV